MCDPSRLHVPRKSQGSYSAYSREYHCSLVVLVARLTRSSFSVNTRAIVHPFCPRPPFVVSNVNESVFLARLAWASSAKTARLVCLQPFAHFSCKTPSRTTKELIAKRKHAARTIAPWFSISATPSARSTLGPRAASWTKNAATTRLSLQRAREGVSCK